mmetsp:Transcript_41380/g.49645  ORF Transcript_41380/g.49645 Transcript_41380/m.49645 type:complete len:353 (-) Transcript_41380:4-1062(-)
MKNYYPSVGMLQCAILVTYSQAFVFGTSQLHRGDVFRMIPNEPDGGPPTITAPPTRPTNSGPPPPNPLLETAFEAAFRLLYTGDDSGIQDSSKNLRVLWTRALLSSLGKIDDDVAFELLPSKTRWLVGGSFGPILEKVFPEVVGKLDWIADRTTFIDKQLDDFLNSTTNHACQVVLLGSGYDTRALRYSTQQGQHNRELKFFEIDLPDISSTKLQLIQHYTQKHQNIDFPSTLVPFDLNDVFTKKTPLLDGLRANGLRDDIPTMFISEAVFFYLIPDAVKMIMSELFLFNKDVAAEARYCFTDNLSKVGVTPGPPMPISPRQKCEKWLNENDKEIVSHDAIWGGAIHFVHAK